MVGRANPIFFPVFLTKQKSFHVSKCAGLAGGSDPLCVQESCPNHNILSSISFQAPRGCSSDHCPAVCRAMRCCTVLYCTVLCCTTLHPAMPHHAMRCCVMPFCTVLHHAMPSCAQPTLCCTTLYLFNRGWPVSHYWPASRELKNSYFSQDCLCPGAGPRPRRMARDVTRCLSRDTLRLMARARARTRARARDGRVLVALRENRFTKVIVFRDVTNRGQRHPSLLAFCSLSPRVSDICRGGLQVTTGFPCPWRPSTQSGSLPVLFPLVDVNLSHSCCIVGSLPQSNPA